MNFITIQLTPDKPIVDGVVSLTGFAPVGGPARQDHPESSRGFKETKSTLYGCSYHLFSKQHKNGKVVI